MTGPLLHHRHGTLVDGADPVWLSPDVAGWDRTALRVVRLEPGVLRTIDTGPYEALVLPLSAIDLTITAGGDRFQVRGRASVFARVTDFVYVGRRTSFDLVAPHGGELALAMARSDDDLPPRYGPAEDVAVETRGAGPATRQVTNFASPDTWAHASRVMAWSC